MRSGVEVIVLIKDKNRVDSFASDERANNRLTSQLYSLAFEREVEKKKVEKSVSCCFVRGKRLTKFPPNTRVNIEREGFANANASESESQSEKENDD